MSFSNKTDRKSVDLTRLKCGLRRITSRLPLQGFSEDLKVSSRGVQWFLHIFLHCFILDGGSFWTKVNNFCVLGTNSIIFPNTASAFTF